MLIREIRAGLFPAPPDIQYVEQLATQTTTDIAEWDISFLEGVPQGDRRAINKAFFARSEQKIEVEIPKVTIESLGILEKLTAQEKAARDTRIAGLAAQIKTLHSDAVYSMKSADEYLTKAYNHRKEIDLLNNRSMSYIKEELQAILDRGFFRWHALEGNCPIFMTPIIIMTEVNERAGINRRVTLGTFKVQLTHSVPLACRADQRDTAVMDAPPGLRP
jgi:hypothetical protein